MDKDKHNRLRHGMFENTSSFSHKERLLIWASADDYIEQIGGEENLKESEKFDAYLLALTEFRIARAEGVMFEDVEAYLEKQTPEQNLEMLVNRRQKLRKDLGLLADSPEAREADAKADFFGAMEDDE